jgi:hypothetical protein
MVVVRRFRLGIGAVFDNLLEEPDRHPLPFERISDGNAIRRTPH